MALLVKQPAYTENLASAYGIAEFGRIRYNGLVNLGDFFRSVRGWFLTHKYLFYEKTMKHKHGSTGIAKEYEWNARKKVYNYLEYTVVIKFKIKDIVDVEVVRDGDKQKLQQCAITVEIEPKLNYDPFKRFGTTMFGQSLSAVYHRFFAKKEVLYVWQGDFENHIKDLQNFILQQLQYESTLTA